jgi:ABC-type nitrate/sulfonate/bicarbonate transport system permease component
MARIGWNAAPWLSVITLLAAWEAFARSGAVTPFMLPALSAVLERIASDAVSGELFQGLGLTLYRSLAGFLIAAAAGILVGVLFVRNRLVRWWFDPIISVGFPMPKIAFLPVITLWLGFYDVSKISMVVFDAAFPVVTATIAATMSVEKELIWSARNLGASDRALLWEIILPASLPQVLTGCRWLFPSRSSCASWPR